MLCNIKTSQKKKKDELSEMQFSVRSVFPLCVFRSMNERRLGGLCDNFSQTPSRFLLLVVLLLLAHTSSGV